MLYISIGLILLGIALVIVSFLSRGRTSPVPMDTTKKPADPKTPSPEGALATRDFQAVDAGDGDVKSKVPQNASAMGRNERGNAAGIRTDQPVDGKNRAPKRANDERKETTGGSVEKPVSRAETPALTVNDKVAALSGETIPGKEPAKDESAVLFHDSSGVIDFETHENIIDPTFQRYSNLKRIGKGRIEILKEGINFQLRKKLYRFEFYGIEKMIPGKNYLALYLKGNDSVRLLIMEGNDALARKIENEFNAYRKLSLQQK